MEEEVIPPLLSVEEAKAPDESDSDYVDKKQEEQMGIFETLDRLEEAVDALLDTKSSASFSSLQEPLKAEVTKKLINCSICPKSFTNVGNLKTHMRFHTSKKPHNCPHCTKSFSQSSDLQSHVRVHSGKKLYTCTQCSKSFAQSSRLQVHLRTHTEKNPIAAPSVLRRLPN